MEVDPLWQPAPGYKVKYDVSCRGEVRTKTRGSHERILIQVTDSSGYRVVSLWSGNKGTMVRVHLLMLKAFVGPCPEGYEAGHRNGVLTDDRLENLYWKMCEHVFVRPDREDDTRRRRGEANHKAKMTEAKVIELRELRGRGKSLGDLGKRYGISKHSVECIAKRRTWSHVGAA